MFLLATGHAAFRLDFRCLQSATSLLCNTTLPMRRFYQAPLEVHHKGVQTNASIKPQSYAHLSHTTNGTATGTILAQPRGTALSLHH